MPTRVAAEATHSSSRGNAQRFSGCVGARSSTAGHGQEFGYVDRLLAALAPNVRALPQQRRERVALGGGLAAWAYGYSYS